MNGENRQMTKEQKREQERYDAFKAEEYSSFKSFHRNVLNDDGIPKIKKTTFRMPGYRKILSDKEIDMYTIDNQRIYDRA